MTANHELIYYLAAGFVLVLIFLIRTERISKTRAVALLGIFALFPLFIYLLDRFFAPGLWEKLVFQNSVEFWIARIAYSLAVLGVGFNIIWLSVGGTVVAGGIILFSANEIIAVKKEAAQKEFEKQQIVKDFQKEKSENSLVPGGTLDISSIEPGTYKIAVLNQETNYLIVEGGDWTINFRDSLLLQTKDEYGNLNQAVTFKINSRGITLTPGSRFEVPWQLGKYDKFYIIIGRVGPKATLADEKNVIAPSAWSNNQKQDFILTADNDYLIVSDYNWLLNWPKNDSLLWQQKTPNGKWQTVMVLFHHDLGNYKLEANSKFKPARLLKPGETFKITITKINI